MCKRYCLLLIVAVACLAVSVTAATVPTNISYQGRLTDAGGMPITGARLLTFRIFTTPTGGSPIWSETQTATATDGLFSVRLGSVDPIQPVMLFDPMSDTETGVRYLEIQIFGDLSPISPRTQLVCAPYAMVAGSVVGTGHVLSANQLSLEDSVTNSIAEVTSQGLTLTGPGGTGVPKMNPTAVFRETRLSTCSLTMADTTGETLAVIDGSAGTFRLRSAAQAKMTLAGIVDGSDADIVEMFAGGASGAGMRFFDLGGEVMGVEPSPFAGASFGVTLYHPQTTTPVPLASMSTDFDGATSGESMLRLRNVSASSGDTSVMKVSLRSSVAGGELRLGANYEPTSMPYIRSFSNDSISRVEVFGRAMFPLPAPRIVLGNFNSSARIGIGTDSPTQNLHVVGNICYTGSIDACSDERFKKDLEPIGDALDAVEKIHGVTYSWRTDDFPDRQFSADRQVGVTAQEVKEVLPEAVKLQEDGYYTVDYSRLTPLLIEAIKELKQQNEELTKRLEQLEKK